MRDGKTMHIQVAMMLTALLILLVPAMAACQEQEPVEDQPFAFFDVTDDLGAFVVSRYFPQGSHPYEDRPGILYLTASELIERYSLRLEELESGTFMGNPIDFRVVGWLVRPMSLMSVSFLFKEKFVQAMALHASEVSKEFRYFGHDEVRTLTPAEQEECFRLAAAWTREAAGCITHVADGTEPGPPVLLGAEDCDFIAQWGGLLLKAQEEPQKTMRTASGLLGKLADRLDQEAAALADKAQAGNQ